MSRDAPARPPAWPDREAHRRRLWASRLFWAAAAALVVLPWFGYRQVRDWLGPGAAVEAAQSADAVDVVDAGGVPAQAWPPAEAEGRLPAAAAPLLAEPAPGDGSAADADDEIEAIGREARAGDGEAAAARLASLGAQVHRDALLADRGSAVRREAARRDVADIAGVRGAGWVDRMTMLLVTSASGSGQATISEACRRLAAHGDVAGLAVRVQQVAGNDVAAASLIGECRHVPAALGLADGRVQPFPGALLRQAPGTQPDDDADPGAAEARRRREEESLRILSESTPELPTADPGVGP